MEAQLADDRVAAQHDSRETERHFRNRIRLLLRGRSMSGGGFVFFDLGCDVLREPRVARRRVLFNKLRDGISKYVRGSESNCEQDSDEMSAVHTINSPARWGVVGPGGTARRRRRR